MRRLGRLRVEARGLADGWAGGSGDGSGLGDSVETVEIDVPAAVRSRAEEIVVLSRRLGSRGGGFNTPAEVLAPALVYGLAHMQERYRQAAFEGAREAAGV
jgi:hypothetical protein